MRVKNIFICKNASVKMRVKIFVLTMSVRQKEVKIFLLTMSLARLPIEWN